MQIRLFHDISFYQEKHVKSVIAYHNPQNPADDQLYFCFYIWANKTLTMWREGQLIQIDNIDILLNNSVRALPYFSAEDVTPASSIPAVIDSRPVHSYNLVYFRLESLMEILPESSPESFRGRRNDAARKVAEEGAKEARNANNLNSSDRRALYFTHSNVKFPSLRATMSYSPLDNFKTLVASHEKTDVLNPTHRENMAVEVGVPCPPRWDEGIAAVQTLLSGNVDKTKKLINGYKAPKRVGDINGIKYRFH